MTAVDQCELRPAEQTSSSQASQINTVRRPLTRGPQSVGTTQIQILPKTSEGMNKVTQSTPKAAAPASPCAKPSMRSIWYLGGNHVIKLLTSVDGDLDHDVLAKIAAVPPVVGDLALSVESLVSDDFTVGGFENDLLARIASNTLAGRQTIPPQKESYEEGSVVSAEPSRAETPPPVPRATTPSHDTTSVPNPLESYQPVPNPLARITPPGSPVPSPLKASQKRKDLPIATGAPSAKRRQISAPAIQAR